MDDPIEPGSKRAARRASVAAPVLALLAAGCGKAGPPIPPEPRGPLPPQQVRARQLGEALVVSFFASPPRGPRPTQTPTRAELVRVEFQPGVAPTSDADVFRRRGAVVAERGVEGVEAGTRVVIEDGSWTDLAGGGIGWTLRYGIRVRDRKGRPSSIVVAHDVVTRPAEPPPLNLRGEATADGIRLAWDAPPGAGPLRFNVYRAVPGGSWPAVPLNDKPLASSEYLDATVTTGLRYSYVVRTALSDEPPYRESASSAAVELTAEDRFPPAAPQGLVAVQEGMAVRLFWDPNAERDLAGYRVYRRDEQGAWTRIGPDPVPEAFYLDPAVRPGQVWIYGIRAVDRAAPPNESPLSETVRVVVAEDPAGSRAPAGSR